MKAPPTDGLIVRHPGVDDHLRVLSVMDDWWGGFGGQDGSRERSLLLPRLYFQHFTDTSFLVEREDLRLVGFLIGFMSQSRPEVGYIHFVGVDPSLRRVGLAGDLYQRFFELAATRGARLVQCVTSPANSASVGFHTRIGFEVDPGEEDANGLMVQGDYDGPGLDRVTFTRRLA